MRLSFIFLFLFSSFSSFAAQLSKVKFGDKEYSLSYSGGKFLASAGTVEIEGKEKKHIGYFYQYDFFTGAMPTDGFLIIFNQKTSKIIKQSGIEAGENLTLYSVSPDSKLVILESGLMPLPRGFEMLTAEGKPLFHDLYMVMHWDKNTFIYSQAKSVPLDLNAQTEKCRDLGAAYEVHQFRFDGVKKIKMDQASTIECSN